MDLMLQLWGGGFCLTNKALSPSPKARETSGKNSLNFWAEQSIFSELAREIIDRRGSFISESSAYRILNSYELVTSPNYIVLSAADKVSAENQMSSRAMAAELYLF